MQNLRAISDYGPRIYSNRALAGDDGIRSLTRGLILLYFICLIFEGAFRKWVVPGLSNPILLVRDPIVIGIYLAAAFEGIFPRDNLLRSLGILAVASTIGACLADTFDWRAYLYGMRSNFLHFPLMFVMARAMNYADVIWFGRLIVVSALPMTYLVVRQFSASPDDILNAVAGGSLGLQIATSGGRVRASGTFSYVTGIIGFYGVVAGLVLNSLLRPGTYAKWIQWAGVAAVAVAVVTSGSRSVAAIVGGACAVVAVTAPLRPQVIGRAIAAFAIVSLVTFIAVQFSVVKEGISVTSARFTDGGGHLGFWMRFINPLFPLLSAPFETPFFGRGLGLGTNAGAGLTGGAAMAFGEDDWSRVIAESGPVIGLSFVVWRCAVVGWMFVGGCKNMRAGNILPLLMLTASGAFILYGQIHQPTIQGFAAFGGGLCLASMRTSNIPKSFPDGGVKPVTTLTKGPARIFRSRSPYAESLYREAGQEKE